MPSLRLPWRGGPKDGRPGGSGDPSGRDVRWAGDATPRRGRWADGAWVPVVGSALLILGVLYLVVFYVAGVDIPGMRELGNWNLAVGMGLIIAGFLVFTRWE